MAGYLEKTAEDACAFIRDFKVAVSCGFSDNHDPSTILTSSSVSP